MNELELYKRYLKDPNLWMQNALGIESIEDYHKKISLDVVEYDRVAIKAAHSLGKTWQMARLALWFFSLHDNAIVITSAPTYRQVKALLWGEIRDAHKNAAVEIGGRLLDTELKYSDKHFMIGFSPQTNSLSSKEQQGSSFQGFHSDNIMIIFDEATSIQPDVWTQAQGLLTSGKIVKFVCIANPTTKNSIFFECFSSPEWKKITITCFDSPNMIANGFTDKEKLQDEIDRLIVMNDEDRINEIQAYKKPKPYLLTAQFVVPYVLRLGMNHPLVLSKVFGEFPKTEDNVLVQYEDVSRAVNREYEIKPDDIRYIGVDVARFGADLTVLTEMVGFKHTATEVLAKRDLTDVTGAVMNMIKSSDRETIVCIDSTGLGAGVHDMLVENQDQNLINKSVQIEEVHFGSTLSDDQDKARYSILKSKLFDTLATDLRDSIDLQDESIYFEELPTIQYKFDSRGRIVIESKKDYKARTGRSSPDYSDSLALANYGRYVNISHGSFYKKAAEAPIVKRDKRESRKTGIKVKEY